MKTMRYRIRMITLLLVCALLFSVLLCVRSVWFPSGLVIGKPEVSPDPVLFPASPEITPAPSGQWPPLPADNALPSPEPLFDTFGL